MRLKREPNTRRMKLNQFFTKPVIEKPQATVFQLSNETREAELENRIRELEAQLARLVDQGEENTSLHKQAEENYKAAIKINDKFFAEAKEKDSSTKKAPGPGPDVHVRVGLAGLAASSSLQNRHRPSLRLG